MGLFGGLSPLVATWLVECTGDEIAPAFLIMATAAVTFLTLFWFRETYRTTFVAAPRTAAAQLVTRNERVVPASAAAAARTHIPGLYLCRSSSHWAAISPDCPPTMRRRFCWPISA